MPFIAADQVADDYDVVIGGTGFGSLFFLEGYLRRHPRARVILLEWGEHRSHDWQVEHQTNSTLDDSETYRGKPGEKPWNFTIGYGGGTNCWWANTPRLHPTDFRLRSTYGVGMDWPISYDDLEPYYIEAEEIMRIAGPDDIGAVYPRSRPYPQPHHNLTTVDRLMKARTPEHHFAVPTARLRQAVDGRGPCCNTANCRFCPTEAKFTALNSFGPLVDRDNVHVLTGARVLTVDLEGGVARGVTVSIGGRERRVSGDLVAIGCNAIHSPFILMRSGLRHPALGRYLHEKHVITFEVLLDGLDHFDGGIPTTGLNTMLLDGEHRRDTAGALGYFMNNYRRDGFRPVYNRWRQTLPLEYFVEDIPLESNGVIDDGGDTPLVSHASRSEYCMRGVERVIARLPEVLAALPVEDVIRRPDLPTGSHLQGTCRMGSDPETSIVDGGLVHHQVRNLMVLGTAVWPTCGMSNPSLTAAALSLRAADLLGA